MDGNESETERRLGNFIPAIVEGRLPADADPGTRREVPAVLLFVDIAGFSRLSADLVAADERGAEEIRRLLNRLFSRIISMVSMHEGGVASIAGDALLAIWTGSDAGAGLAQAARNAAACAEEIAAMVGSEEPAAHDLSVKMLLDGGHIHLTAVGGRDGQVFPILSGPLFDSLQDRSLCLSSGKTLATRRFVGLSRGAAQYEADPSGLERLVRVAPGNRDRTSRIPAPRTQTRFVPPLARALIGHSADDWVAEFRRATILFAAFPPDAAQDVEDLVALTDGIQDAMLDYGGAIVQFQSDDKGLILIAGWGLAVGAFEDNAERAIRAAQSLLEATERMSTPCRIGISTGNLWCGVLGGEDYRQVTVLSESVNLASALAMRAGDGILVDDETMALARNRFVFEDRGTFRPKGRDAPVPVYRPSVEALVEREFKSDIVGRRDELDRMLAAFPECGKAPLLQIHGVAGLGKSHLGAVLAARLADTGRQTIFAHGDSLRRTTALHVWRRPFAKLLENGRAEGEDLAAQLHRLLEGQSVTDLHRAVLRQLMDVDAGMSPELAATSPEVRAQASREAMVALLEALVGARRTVLFFEDAHWMDSASWQLLAEVRRKLPEIGIVLLSRPVADTDLPVQALRMLRDEFAEPVLLAPLDRAETDALICTELGIAEAPPKMLDRIFELAEGHPLYTKELAKLFVNRELVHVESGYCHVHSTKIDLSEAQFPGGLEGAVSGRISTLPPEVQLTLKVAAVQGRNVDHHIIAQSHPLPDAPIRAHLDRIHASGLMEPVSEGKSRFHHALIVDTACDMLLTDQRQSLHRRIAALYERALEDGATQVPNALVAHHWDNGGEPAHAVRHLELAAEQAYENQASTEVVTFLSRALELNAAHGGLLEPQQKGRMHLWLASALMSLGHLVATDEHLAAALTIYDKAPPDGDMAYVRRLIALYFRIVLRRRSPDAPEDPAKLNASRVYATLAEVYYDRQDTLRTLHAAFSAMDLAASSGGDSGPLAMAMSQLSLTALYMPWALNGDRWQRDAVEMAERLDDPFVSGWVYMTTGAYAFARARFPEAEELTQRSVRQCERARDAKCWEYAVANLGNIHRLQGRFRLADDCDVKTHDSGHDRGVPQVKLWGITGRMKNLWALNEFDAFEDSLARCRSLITDDLNKLNSAASNTIAYHIFASLDSIRKGNTAAGLEDLSVAVRLYQGLSDPQIYMVDPVSYVLDAGHGLHRRGVPSATIRDIFGVMASTCRKLVKLYPSARARLALSQGDLAQIKGDMRTARAKWSRAADEAVRYRMPFDAAMAQFRLAHRAETDRADAARRSAMVTEQLDRLEMAQPLSWTI